MLGGKKLKPDQDLVAWIVLFFAGFALGVITNFEFTSAPEWLYGAIATLVAAFGGSYIAFRLQRDHEDRKRQAAHKLAANNTLFRLGQMINTLNKVNSQFLKPHRENLPESSLYGPCHRSSLLTLTSTCSH